MEEVARCSAEPMGLENLMSSNSLTIVVPNQVAGRWRHRSESFHTCPILGADEKDRGLRWRLWATRSPRPWASKFGQITGHRRP